MSLFTQPLVNSQTFDNLATRWQYGARLGTSGDAFMKAAEKHCSSLAGQIQHTGVWPRDLPLHYFEKAMEQAMYIAVEVFNVERWEWSSASSTQLLESAYKHRKTELDCQRGLQEQWLGPDALRVADLFLYMHRPPSCLEPFAPPPPGQRTKPVTTAQRKLPLTLGESANLAFHNGQNTLGSYFNARAVRKPEILPAVQSHLKPPTSFQKLLNLPPAPTGRRGTAGNHAVQPKPAANVMVTHVAPRERHNFQKATGLADTVTAPSQLPTMPRPAIAVTAQMNGKLSATPTPAPRKASPLPISRLPRPSSATKVSGKTVPPPTRLTSSLPRPARSRYNGAAPAA